MAEAIKSGKSIVKAKVNAESVQVANSSAPAVDTTEITDENLQMRLKSLTSFINNIEPTAKEPQSSEVFIYNFIDLTDLFQGQLKKS